MCRGLLSGQVTRVLRLGAGYRVYMGIPSSLGLLVFLGGYLRGQGGDLVSSCRGLSSF